MGANDKQSPGATQSSLRTLRPPLWFSRIPTQGAQYPLIKQRALDHIRRPSSISGVFLKEAILGSLVKVPCTLNLRPKGPSCRVVWESPSPKEPNTSSIWNTPWIILGILTELRVYSLYKGYWALCACDIRADAVVGRVGSSPGKIREKSVVAWPTRFKFYGFRV